MRWVFADMCKASKPAVTGAPTTSKQHHVLEILTSFSKSCEKGEYIPLKTKYYRTAPMQNNPMHGILD